MIVAMHICTMHNAHVYIQYTQYTVNNTCCKDGGNRSGMELLGESWSESWYTYYIFIPARNVSNMCVF